MAGKVWLLAFSGGMDQLASGNDRKSQTATLTTDGRGPLTQDIHNLQQLGGTVELLQGALELSPFGVVIFDEDLKLVFCNQQLKDLLDFPDNAFQDRSLSLEDFFRFKATRGEYGAGKIEAYVQQKLMLVGLNRPHIYERTRPNGTVLEVRATPLANGGLVMTYLDVTRERAYRLIENEDTSIDPATKLPKQEFIERHLRFSLKKQNPGDIIGLYTFQLNQFLGFIKKNGHRAADLVLQQIAGRLQRTVQGLHVCAKVDEGRFMVLQAPVTTPQQVSRFVSRLHDEVCRPIIIEDKDVSFRISFGMAFAPRDGLKSETLIATAQEAKFETKDEMIRNSLML